jgi:transposase
VIDIKTKSGRAERKALALAMRSEGKTFAEIAQRLGVSRQRVHQMLRPKESKACCTT